VNFLVALMWILGEPTVSIISTLVYSLNTSHH
jgi:hypothetical protein